jgi:hypothetical protein
MPMVSNVLGPEGIPSSQLASDRFWVDTMGYHREEIQQLLAIEGQVQLVWVMPKATENLLTPSKVDLHNPQAASLAIAPGLKLDKQFWHSGKLGPVVHAPGKTLALRPEHVSKLSANGFQELTIELTRDGRESLWEARHRPHRGWSCGGLRPQRRAVWQTGSI